MKERWRVSDAQKSLASADWYQAAFVCAQEYVATDSTSASSLSSVSPEATPSMNISEVPSLGVLDCDEFNLPGVEPMNSNDVPCSDSDDDSSVEEQPHRHECAVEASDGIVYNWAMNKTEHGKKIVADYKSICGKEIMDTEDVQNLIALEELVQLRREYLEEKMVAKKSKPRQKIFTERSRMILQERLKLGKEYLAWIDMQPEHVQKRCGLAAYLGFPSDSCSVCLSLRLFYLCAVSVSVVPSRWFCLVAVSVSVYLSLVVSVSVPLSSSLSDSYLSPTLLFSISSLALSLSLTSPPHPSLPPSLSPYLHYSHPL